MISLVHFIRSLLLALFAPRLSLLGENLVLRQQVIVLRRAVSRSRFQPFDRWLISSLVGRFRALLAVRIGVAFENRDGSWNLIFDYLPARMEATTVQLRDVEAKDQKAE